MEQLDGQGTCYFIVISFVMLFFLSTSKSFQLHFLVTEVFSFCKGKNAGYIIKVTAFPGPSSEFRGV